MRLSGPLFTDLYELTMAACYHALKMTEDATFSLFIRKYPPKRNYFVAAGLEGLLKEVEGYRFVSEDLDFLASTGLFNDPFLKYLSDFKFSGKIFALKEGTIFFPDEPILEVTAPIIEAQLLETFILNTVGFQTLIASKAARCVEAAKGRPLIDFSSRRTQGLDAALKVARSAYIAGFEGTSNVLAGKTYKIPLSGTMAHSFVMVFNHEVDAFTAFSEQFKKNSIFLIDTYDTIKGAKAAAEVAIRMKEKGNSLIGVRLDSGDFVKLSKQVRKILKSTGLNEVKLFATGNFDENKIKKVLSKGAEIDAFGVGTRMGVSADAPYLDIVYKMVRFHDRNVRKLSPHKKTLAGEKQIFRIKDRGGYFKEDILGLRIEKFKGTTKLLEKVMEDGKLIVSHPSLNSLQRHFKEELSHLPSNYRSFSTHAPFPVKISPALLRLQKIRPLEKR